MKHCPHCGFALEQPRALFDDLKKMVVRGQPATSWDAAYRTWLGRSKTQRDVSNAFMDLGPMTDLELHHQCCARYGPRAESSYRKRRTELTEMGWVRDTGKTKVEDGERRVVWDLSDTGRQIFQLMKSPPKETS